MKTTYSDGWATVYAADALEGAQLLGPRSVHTIVTSPPYWGLRSYLPSGHPDKPREIGAESSPEAWCENLVGVFRALRPALHDSGTLWVVVGDSYASGEVGRYDRGIISDSDCGSDGKWRDVSRDQRKVFAGTKPKDLVGLPWMLAFALRAGFSVCSGCGAERRSDLWPVEQGHKVCLRCLSEGKRNTKIIQTELGWYLRRDIIWSKPNPMPESVTDRPTSAHEYVFLFSKSPRYFFDQEAVREPATEIHRQPNAHQQRPNPVYEVPGQGAQRLDAKDNGRYGTSRNIRSVWAIATKTYPGSHYATFPPDLVYPCVKAGTSERGVCAACGSPRERAVERTPMKVREGPGRRGLKESANGASSSRTAVTGTMTEPPTSRTVGWQPTCSCDAETVPATVLDPFVGSGTTLWAARKLGRKSVGFDLDARNLGLIEERMGNQGVLF